MKLSARNAIRPDEIINDVVVISTRYDDDTPSYYAVPRDECAGQTAIWSYHGAYVNIIGDMTPEAAAHLWIGIKVASIGGCAAWGRCDILAA